MKPIQVTVKFDLKGTYKISKYPDGSIKHEEVSSEEGSLINAQEGKF